MSDQRRKQNQVVQGMWSQLDYAFAEMRKAELFGAASNSPIIKAAVRTKVIGHLDKIGKILEELPAAYELPKDVQIAVQPIYKNGEVLWV